MPDRSAFGYTLDHLADVVHGLLDQLGIGKLAIYVMDIGAAVGFRLARAECGGYIARSAAHGP